MTVASTHDSQVADSPWVTPRAGRVENLYVMDAAYDSIEICTASCWATSGFGEPPPLASAVGNAGEEGDGAPLGLVFLDRGRYVVRSGSSGINGRSRMSSAASMSALAGYNKSSSHTRLAMLTGSGLMRLIGLKSSSPSQHGGRTFETVRRNEPEVAKIPNRRTPTCSDHASPPHHRPRRDDRARVLLRPNRSGKRLLDE